MESVFRQKIEQEVSHEKREEMFNAIELTFRGMIDSVQSASIDLVDKLSL